MNLIFAIIITVAIIVMMGAICVHAMKHKRIPLIAFSGVVCGFNIGALLHLLSLIR